MPARFLIDTARPDERAAAFRLAFQHLPEAEKELRVCNALNLVHAGDLDTDGIFVVRHGAELGGALVCVPLRGAGGLLWPPGTCPGPEQTLEEDQLIQTGLDWLKNRRGAKLAQAITTPAEVPLAKPLVRNGFQHLTHLDYLRHRLEHLHPSTPAPAGVSCRTYVQEPNVFRQTLLRTYEGTQDCPELNGIRTIDEILDGHRAQGVFHPERWRLACDQGEGVGVLLATEIPEWQGWDISYVGVVPEARRRGIGRWLTQLLLREARAADARQVTLAVDARNSRARKLYAQLGFEHWDQREAFLRFFPVAPGATSGADSTSSRQ